MTATIKWTHENINQKIQEVMQIKEPGKLTAPLAKPSLTDIMNLAKQTPQLPGMNKTQVK